MMQVSVSKVNVNFECINCNKTEQCSISEAVENGAPICSDCDDIMEIVDCEITSI
jgi:transcription elongation factor Elf1